MNSSYAALTLHSAVFAKITKYACRLGGTKNMNNSREINGQRVVPFWTQMGFDIVERFRLSHVPYARFIYAYPTYHELSVERIIHCSEELLSFVQSHSEEPVTILILNWLPPRYFAHLQWL